MEKTYFFISRRVNGRMLIFPISGQTTFRFTTHTRKPIILNSDIRVRVSTDTLHIVCGLPEGTIYAITYHSEYSTEGDIRGRELGIIERNQHDAQHILVSFYDVPVIYPIACQYAPAQMTYRPVSIPENLQADLRTLMASRNRNSEHIDKMKEEFRNFTLNRTPVTENKAVLTVNCPKAFNLFKSNFRPLNRNNNEAKYQFGQIFNLYKGLSLGICKFIYRKNDGSVRIAYGTINPNIISYLPNCPTETNSNLSHNNGEYFNYYDLGKQDWRKFKISRVNLASIHIVELNPSMKKIAEISAEAVAQIQN